MSLEPLDILNGSFSIFFVLISLIVGIIIILKYRQYRSVTHLLIGLTWIGLTTPWLPSTVSFLKYLITTTGIDSVTYFTIGNIASPLILIIWIYSFTEFKFKDKRNLLLIIYSIVGLVFEIYLVYFLINDPTVIGSLSGDLDVTYRGVVLLWAVFIVVTVLITGVLFGRESMKSDDPEITLKGKFLIVAFVSWAIGAVMDAALPLNIVTLTIARIILISSAIEFYIGFILPKIVKKLFLKNK
jgi:hypothetical protein